MTEFGAAFGAVLPVFLVTGTGFFLRRLAWLTAEADQSLLRLTINVLLPGLMIDATLGNPALAEWRNLVFAPLIGAGTFCLGLLVSRAAAGAAGLDDLRARRTFGLAAGLYNYGFVPIPLALLLFGQQTVGVLFVHNVGVEMALWTVGVIMITGHRGELGFKRLMNAPLVAMLTALILNFSGAWQYLPKILLTTIHLLAQCAIPMSLLLAGATMDDHLEEFHAQPRWRVIGVAVLIRLAVLPLIQLVLAKFAPATLELKRVMVLQAAMPSAVFPIVMAKHYGGDPPTALRVVLGTSVVGLVTIPFWIHLGLEWVCAP